MAYVNVPMDLAKVKNKVAFNLTMRQIICIGAGAAVGFPFYFLTRGIIGTGNAATGMVLLMAPEFLLALYEKDGMHLEQILMNIIRVRFLRPAIRRYETANFYAAGQEETGGKKAVKKKEKEGGTRRAKPKEDRRKAAGKAEGKAAGGATAGETAGKTDFRTGYDPL